MRTTREQDEHLSQVRRVAENYRHKSISVEQEIRQRVREEMDRYRLDRDLAVMAALDAGCKKAWVTKALGSSPNLIYEITERMQDSPLVRKTEVQHEVTMRSGSGVRSIYVTLNWTAYPAPDNRTIDLRDTELWFESGVGWRTNAETARLELEDALYIQSEANNEQSLLTPHLRRAYDEFMESEQDGI